MTSPGEVVARTKARAGHSSTQSKIGRAVEAATRRMNNDEAIQKHEDAILQKQRDQKDQKKYAA